MWGGGIAHESGGKGRNKARVREEKTTSCEREKSRIERNSFVRP